VQLEEDDRKKMRSIYRRMALCI